MDAESPPPDDALRALVEELDASGAALYVIREDHGLLVPTATFGPQAAFLKSAAPVAVESHNELARVYSSGEPIYVAESFPAPGSESPNGVGRWRSAIPTGSHAVLPVRHGQRCVGVLSLQWSDAREFSDDEIIRTRYAVETMVRDIVPPSSGPRDRVLVRPPLRVVPPEEPTPPPTHPTWKVGYVSPDGDYAPEDRKPPRPWAASVSALVVRAPSFEAGCAFNATFRLSGKRFGIVAGTLKGSPSHADDLAGLIVSVLRTHSLRSGAVGRACVRAMEAVAHAYEQTSSASLIYGVVDLKNRLLTYDVRDEPAPIVVKRGGRVVRLESSSSKEGHAQMFLPGETLLLHSRGATSASRGGRQYGAERLQARLQEMRPIAGIEMPAALYADIAEFAHALTSDVQVVALTLYAH